jgi:GNAT superfamily N-acetyltransferase
MDALLRRATNDDAAAVADVLIESRLVFLPFAPSVHPPHEVRQWVAEHLLPTGRVHVAEVAGRVVGVLATSADEAHFWIDQLYVLPGYEARGIGTQLLQLAHADLGRPIRLYTFQANAGARRFYERHGYGAVEFTDGHSNEERCPDVLYQLDAEVTEP